MLPTTENGRTTPPGLDRLFARYLDRPAAPASPAGEAEPHEAAGGQRLATSAAWAEVVATAARLLGVRPALKQPAFFADAVAALPRAHALPMAAGHYPQQVFDLQPFLGDTPLKELARTPAAEPPPSLVKAVADFGRTGDALARSVAAGLLRQLRAFSAADELTADDPNERGATAWARGDLAEAAELWARADETPAVVFNRGVAALFAGDARAAVPLLRRAAGALADDDSWQHLAGFYLAVAEIHAA